MTIDHYEALFDSTYLRWFDLNGKDVTVTIESVKQEELTLRGGKKKKAPVVRFVGKKKPLVLNRTNADKMAELAGTNQVSKWAGVAVTLYQTTTNLGGQTTECIRVKKASK